MMSYRKIIHVDMDAFYASVEQRDRPQLKGKPVIVGGMPNSRGVVAACSYEARQFGIHSAMPSAHAFRLCPKSIFLAPRFDAYQAVSKQIHQIFKEYTDLIEPLSLDEAFLDVTHNKKDIQYATTMAKLIRKDIYEKTGLTASAGVSYNKFLAKIASDNNKPDGMTIVTPDDADQFIQQLPIGRFFGVGKVTERRMHSLGIFNGADLKKFTQTELTVHFGKAGSFFYDIVRGIDNRPVVSFRRRKSIGKETTLVEDINDHNQIMEILKSLTHKVAEQLQQKHLFARTMTVKVKYFNFKQVTRTITLKKVTNDAEEMINNIPSLLSSTQAGQKKVRLLGVSVANLCDDTYQQYYQLELPINIIYSK